MFVLLFVTLTQFQVYIASSLNWKRHKRQITGPLCWRTKRKKKFDILLLK